jgi:hypothetical protein
MIESVSTSEAMTAPDVGGRPALPKRNGARGMVPTTWLSRAVRIEYTDAEGGAVSTSATLLDWCGLGVVINSKGARCIVAWDRIAIIELTGS